MKKHSSIWRENLSSLNFNKKLTGEIQTDIVIVGAGVTGLTTAYLLAKAGKKVVILEKDTVASGDSMLTTAFLSYVSDADISELVKKFGEKNGAEVWRSMKAAIDKIESIIKEEKIDCEFKRCPLFYYAFNAKDKKILDREFKLIKKLGFETEFSENFIEPFEFAIKFPKNAKFHPLKYLYSLAKIITELEGVIYENTEAISYEHYPEPVVRTSKGRVRAKKVIIATHNPNNWAFEIHTRIRPMNTYILAGKCENSKLKEGLYIDTFDPYHYLRLDKISDKEFRFLLGGEDHETGKKNNEEQHKNLENYLKLIFTNGNYKITHMWSGQVIETVDGLPFIGELVFSPSHLLAGTGFAGDGYPFGTLSGMIASDKVLEVKNPWAELYKSKRFKGFKSFLEVNVNFIKEFAFRRIKTKKDGLTIKSLKKNSGIVIKENGKNVAVYKNESGEISKTSAVCTHLGCVVGWNDEAKTWDCPCHGSRFNKDGSVSRGPARRPLKKIS